MLYLILIVCNILCKYMVCTETFDYENGHIFGVGRRYIKHRNLPPEYTKSVADTGTPRFSWSPFKSLFQGVRRQNETCVFNRKYEYPVKNEPYKFLCQNIFECTLTHLMVKTSVNKPVVLRGGVGYNYFTVVVQAEPGDALDAHIQAFCPKIKKKKSSKKRTTLD